MRALPIAMAFVLGVSGCAPPSPAEAVEDLQALFPTLAEYGVTNLWRSDECEYIAYERGAFVTDPDDIYCESIDVLGPHPRSAIDDQARADLDAIYRESERHGPRIQAAFPTFGPAGTITGGTFGFQVCTAYIYEPGWSQLPPEDSDVVTAVNADWYEIRCLTGE